VVELEVETNSEGCSINKWADNFFEKEVDGESDGAEDNDEEGEIGTGKTDVFEEVGVNHDKSEDEKKPEDKG